METSWSNIFLAAVVGSIALVPYQCKVDARPFYLNDANSRKSHCGRQHSCPSAWGIYICGDKGNASNCPSEPDFYDRYMVLGCRATRQGENRKALEYYNSALIAARKEGITDLRYVMQSIEKVGQIPGCQKGDITPY